MYVRMSFILLSVFSVRSIASSKASSPQRVIQCFLFQFTVPSLFLKVIQQLLTSSFSSSRHFYPSLYLSSNNVFQKAVPTQDVTNPVSLRFIVCRMFLSFSTRCNTSSFLTWSFQISSPSFYSITFQTFPGIFDLLSEVSKFHHRTKLYSKCSNLLVFCLNLSPICW